MQDRFDRLLCRESIRSALHRLGFSWKKTRKLLGRADPARRMKFIQDLRALRDGAQRDRYQLVYVDEAHMIASPEMVEIRRGREVVIGRVR